MPSSSAKQSRFMAAIANNPSFAKKVGVSQSVGKDFAAADKGKTFAKGGVAQQKINKQNTRHGKVDLPVANLNRFAGMKKGGMMKTRRFAEGGLEDEGFDKSGEGEDTVYRKSFSGGVKMRDEAPAAKTAPKAPVKSASNSISDKSDMGPQDDTSGVSGSSNPRRMGFRREMPSAARKEENAQNLAKELATTAAMGGVGKLAQNVYRVNKAANTARRFGADKAAVAGEAAAWREASAAPRKKIITPSAKKFEKQINSGEIAIKKGGAIMKEPKGMMKKEVSFMQKKGAPKSMIKHEKAEMGMAKGGMPMKDGKPLFMKKKMMGGGMAKYAKGGGIEARGKTKGTIIRMASGGSVSSASRRADGIAQRGKTRC